MYLDCIQIITAFYENFSSIIPYDSLFNKQMRKYLQFNTKYFNTSHFKTFLFMQSFYWSDEIYTPDEQPTAENYFCGARSKFVQRIRGNTHHEGRCVVLICISRSIHLSWIGLFVLSWLVDQWRLALNSSHISFKINNVE